MPLTLDTINELQSAADAVIKDAADDAAGDAADSGAVKSKRNRKAAPPVSAAVDEPIGDDDDDDDGNDNAPAPAPVKKRRGRPPKTKAPKAAPKAAPDGSTASQIVALQDDLRAACAAVADAEAARDALIERIGELCAS